MYYKSYIKMFSIFISLKDTIKMELMMEKKKQIQLKPGHIKIKL